MSDAYDRDLVAAESSTFERLSGATVGLAFLTMLVAAAALFGFVPMDGTVAGLSLYRYFGLATLATGLTVLGLGAGSRLELVATAPSEYSGLPTGLCFGGLWFVAGGLVAANTLGLGSVAWYTVAPLAGLGVLLLTVVTREDVGTTVPVGLLLVGAGLAVLSGLLGQGWAWSPASLSATFPAHVVVPLLAYVSALLGGWTAGKAYNGFGSRGRQTGAYLLISLVVVAVLSVLVALVVFIGSRGLGPVLENVAIGAASGLTVSLVPVVVLGIWLTDGLDLGTRVGTVKSLVVVVAFVAAVALAALFVVSLVTGRTFGLGGVTIQPVGRVGTGVALVVLLALLAVARTRYDGTEALQSRDTVPERVRAGLLVAGLALASLAGVAVLTSMADGVVGLVVAPAVAGVAASLAVYPTVLLVRRALAGDPVRSRAAPVPELRLGVTGGLAFLALAVAFEFGSGIVPVALPSLPVVGSRVVVSVAAQFVAASFLVYAAVLVAVRLQTNGATAAGNHSTEQVSLAILGALGALTLLVVHAVVTFNELVFFDLIAVTPFGAIDWPFLTNPSQGLGLQRGVMPAVVGTVWLVVGAVVMAVPLAVGAAVYLTEYAEESALTRGVEIATNGLWSTPSIVFGLFGLAFIVPRFGNSKSIFAGQLVLAFMLLPLVLITSREAMLAVPDEYRDASAALGVSQWETIRSVVIPAAMPGVITGVILGVGRIAGETAPILLVMGGANFPTQGPNVLGNFDVSLGLQPPFVHVTNQALLEAASALPYQLYAIITAGVGGNESFAWGTALVLLGVVLSFYAIGIASRRYFRRKLDQ